MFTIYALLDPETLHIRYIGFTSDPKRRKRDHTKSVITKVKYGYYTHWRLSLQKKGLVPIFAVLGSYEDEAVAIEAERVWIIAAKDSGFKLVNWEEGGKVYRRGPFPKEWRENISKSRTGIKCAPPSEELRRKSSERMRELWKRSPKIFGDVGTYERTERHRQPRSLEVRQKIAEAHRGKKRAPFSAEWRANMSAERKRRIGPAVKMTPEVRAKISAARRAYYASKRAAV